MAPQDRPSDVAPTERPVLAVIGARSGSEGVVGKNLRDLGGHPLLGWAVATARRAASVDRVIVSTDAEDYAAVARAYGAETPVLRPAGLSTSTSTDLEFILHLLAWLDATEDYRPAIVVRLLATVPFQAAEDVDAAVALLREDPSASASVVVAPARQHPSKALRIVTDAAGRTRAVPYLGLAGTTDPTARQAYDAAYVRANVVATRTTTIATTGTLTGEALAVHVIPAERGLDIDTELDLTIASCLIDRLEPRPTPPRPIDAPDEEHPA